MELSKYSFDNRKEQSEIKLAVTKSIPANVRYYNLIIAFAEMLARFTEQAFKEEVFNKSLDTEP